jgi:polar amino acid transport system substrate-binding protein
VIGRGWRVAVMRSCIVSLIAILFLAVVPFARADAVEQRAKARGYFVAAAVPDALPLAAYDGTGTIEGFDISVATELARRLGLPVRFVTPGWDAILAGGWDDKWDFAVSNITPTEERGRRIDFPAVYRFEAVVAVVHKDSAWALKPANLSGKRVGVARATTFEQYLTRSLTIYAGEAPPPYLIDDPRIELFPNKQTALEAIAKGDGMVVDAIVTSYSTAQAAIDKGMPVKVVPGFLFWEPVAVAVDHGDAAFATRVAETVEAMLDDGTLSALSLKWFGIDMTAPALL